MKMVRNQRSNPNKEFEHNEELWYNSFQDILTYAARMNRVNHYLVPVSNGQHSNVMGFSGMPRSGEISDYPRSRRGRGLFRSTCDKIPYHGAQVGFDDAFYPIVFGVCCAMANYNILLGGGALQSAEGDQYGAMLTRICTKGRDAVVNACEIMQRKRAHSWSVREAQAKAGREEEAHDRKEDEQWVIAAFRHPEGEDSLEAED
jgi:hypothetical protein